jgi:hypothetical protein
LAAFPDRDSDALYSPYVIGGIAYQYLLAIGNDSYINNRRDPNGEMLSRDMYYALPTRRSEVWKEIWLVALALHSSIIPGEMFAQSLIEISDDESDRSYAITVLLDNMAQFNPNGRSLYQLARLVSADSDLAASLREMIANGISISGGWMNLALLYMAASLLEGDPSLRREYLEKSVSNFARASWDPYAWQINGPAWVDACTELRRLGCNTVECDQTLRAVRSKIERSRR